MAYVIFYLLAPITLLIVQGVFPTELGNAFKDRVGCPEDTRDPAKCVSVLLLIRYGFAMFIFEMFLSIILFW